MGYLIAAEYPGAGAEGGCKGCGELRNSTPYAAAKGSAVFGGASRGSDQGVVVDLRARRARISDETEALKDWRCEKPQTEGEIENQGGVRRSPDSSARQLPVLLPEAL